MILDKKAIQKVIKKKLERSKVCECACCHRKLIDGGESSAVFSDVLNQGVCLSCYFQADAPIICVEDVQDQDMKEIARIALIDKCVESLQKVAI